jgi:probable rRNA maturation factor
MGLTMDIDVLFDEGFEGFLDAGWLQKVAGIALSAGGASPDSELGIVVTGQEKIRDLNLAHLGEDGPTDVLAFPMALDDDPEEVPFVMPPDGAVHLGEVIISYPQAVIQAEAHHHPVEKEVAILVIHGILHLMGHDHDEPEAEGRMRLAEAEILGKIEEPGL